MSMMMPPDPSIGQAPAGGPPGMPLPPGGGGDVPPMDAMSSTQLPGDQGIGGLIAALQGGGGGGGLEGLGLPGGAGPLDPAAGGPPDGSETVKNMSPVEHIQQAMKHLMMAMAGESDDERGTGIVKGMGALQALLGGEAKKQKILASAGG